MIFVAFYGIAGIVLAALGRQSIFVSLYLATVGSVPAFKLYRLSVAMVAVLLVGGFVLPALFAAATAVRGMHCSNNPKPISDAISENAKGFGQWPSPFIASDNGKPLHRWRVLLLPFLGESKPFEEIDLSKPWNDPKNPFLSMAMPKVYRCPESLHPLQWLPIEPETTYVAVIGRDTIWSWPLPLATQDQLDQYGGRPLVIELEKHKMNSISSDDPTPASFLATLDIESKHGDFAYYLDVPGNAPVLVSNARAYADMADWFTARQLPETNPAY